MKKFDMVFLDLDGTILNVFDRHYKVYQNIVENYGGRLIPQDTYIQLVREKYDKSKFLKKSRLDLSAIEYTELFIKNIEKTKFLVLDTISIKNYQFLSLLHNSDLEVNLITNRRNRVNLIKQLKDLKLYNFFDSILVADIKDLPKRKILIDYIPKSSNALVIGDTEEDISLSKIDAVTTYAITTGLRDKNFLNTKNQFEFLHNIKDVLF